MVYVNFNYNLCLELKGLMRQHIITKLIVIYIKIKIISYYIKWKNLLIFLYLCLYLLIFVI